MSLEQVGFQVHVVLFLPDAKDPDELAHVFENVGDAFPEIDAGLSFFNDLQRDLFDAQFFCALGADHKFRSEQIFVYDTRFDDAEQTRAMKRFESVGVSALKSNENA